MKTEMAANPETERAALVNSLLSLLDDQTLGLEEDQEDIIKEAAVLLAADSKAGGEPIGFMHAGQLDELRQKRAPYGYVYAEQQAGASVPVFGRPQQQVKPLTEEQLVCCIVAAGCLGTVKLSFESGPYDIDRPTLNATKLCKAIERAHGIGDHA